MTSVFTPSSLSSERRRTTDLEIKLLSSGLQRVQILRGGGLPFPGRGKTLFVSCFFLHRTSNGVKPAL